MPRTPPQKAAQKAAPTINELTDRVSAMAIERKKPSAYKNWSMDFNFPFMIKTFLHDGRESVTVDLLIPTVYEERVHPRVVSQGTSLAVGVAIPDFFPEEDRVLVAMGHNNINSSQAAAHSEVVQQIRKQYNDMPEIIGNPQIIKLPIPCKEQILHWENQLFHGDAEVSAALGEQQYFSVLRIDLFSTKRPTGRRNRGGMRVVGSPQLADHARQQQQQQQQQNVVDGGMALN